MKNVSEQKQIFLEDASVPENYISSRNNKFDL
jgi:hypothetical protein